MEKFSPEEMSILKSLVENEIIEVSNSINRAGYTDWNGCFRDFTEEQEAGLAHDRAVLLKLASKLGATDE